MPESKFNLLSVTPCMFFFLGRKTTVDQLRNQFLMAHMLPSLRGKRQIILRILKSFWLQVWISDIMANYDIPYAPVRQVGQQKQKKLFMYFNQSYFFSTIL